MGRRPSPRRVAARSVASSQIVEGAVTTAILSPAVVATIDDAQTTADDALVTADDAQTTAIAAQTTADGKNKIYRQTSAPGGASHATGDLWFDTDDDNKFYRWTGAAWDGFELGDSAIASISANKITAGTIDASVITVSNLDAGNITTGSLSANRISGGTITGVTVDAQVGDIGGFTLRSGTLVGEDASTIINPNGNIDMAGDIFASGDLNCGGDVNATGDVEATNINNQGITCVGLTAFGTANRMGLIWDNPDFKGVVDGGGATMVLGTTSDVRFKENITNLESTFIEKLLNEVRIVEYTPKAILANDVPKTKKRTGIIAQEIINVFPDLVVGDYENPENFLSVNYAGFVPYLIKTVQYMSNQIETLEARIAALESQP